MLFVVAAGGESNSWIWGTAFDGSLPEWHRPGPRETARTVTGSPGGRNTTGYGICWVLPETATQTCNLSKIGCASFKEFPSLWSKSNKTNIWRTIADRIIEYAKTGMKEKTGILLKAQIQTYSIVMYIYNVLWLLQPILLFTWISSKQEPWHIQASPVELGRVLPLSSIGGAWKVYSIHDSLTRYTPEV